MKIIHIYPKHLVNQLIVWLFRFTQFERSNSEVFIARFTTYILQYCLLHLIEHCVTFTKKEIKCDCCSDVHCNAMHDAFTWNWVNNLPSVWILPNHGHLNSSTCVYQNTFHIRPLLIWICTSMVINVAAVLFQKEAKQIHTHALSLLSLL